MPRITPRVALRRPGAARLHSVAVPRNFFALQPVSRTETAAESHGGVALILGIVGIYSLLAYVVSQRRRDIGIRLALGASHGRLMGDVVRQALLLAGTGIVFGSGTAWALTRVLVRLLGGGSAYDPGFTSQGWLVVPTFVGAAVVFAVVALAAASIPAFRTTRVNPAVALSST